MTSHTTVCSSRIATRATERLGLGHRGQGPTAGRPPRIDILYARLRNASDIGRIGKNTCANVHTAISQAGVIRRDDFLTISDGKVIVRSPMGNCRRTIDTTANWILPLLRLTQDVAKVGEDE